MQPTHDLNVRSLTPLVPPRVIKSDLPMSEAANQTVVAGREAVKAVLAGSDDRMLCVVGPCSIHHEPAALEYAQRLKTLADQVANRMLLVMRVYFEKPRTTVGWKGLLNDPHLDDTFDIEGGLRLGRRLLMEINELGLPCATEVLDPVTPQYLDELITLASIGARTTESPIHRQMSSGLSMPVGYKNGTDGSLEAPINAMLAACRPHAFVGIDPNGQVALVQTRGNSWGHLILRGGRSGPNYSAEHLSDAASQLEQAGLSPRLMVDCSHANSSKDFRRQPEVFRAVVDQRLAGNANVIGLMLESNIHEGNQKLVDPDNLDYGISITDACLGWDDTERLILESHQRLLNAPAAVGG